MRTWQVTVAVISETRPLASTSGVGGFDELVGRDAGEAHNPAEVVSGALEMVFKVGEECVSAFGDGLLRFGSATAVAGHDDVNVERFLTSALRRHRREVLIGAGVADTHDVVFLVGSGRPVHDLHRRRIERFELCQECQFHSRRRRSHQAMPISTGLSIPTTKFGTAYPAT